jgi:glutathione S-transferase
VLPLPGHRLAGSHPNLAKLYDKLMQRPAFADTVPHD